LNKNTKIRLNYLIGAVISVILLYSLYLQIQKQLTHVDPGVLFNSGLTPFLVLAVLLMPLNIAIEAFKWKILADVAQPTSYKDAFKSVLGGIAFSIITPNRIGEYPGRILYMKRKNTIRLISVAILAAFAQFLTLFIFGIIGLLYYNARFPGTMALITLIAAVIILIIIALVFLRFESWSGYFEYLSWFRRFQTYGHLLKRFTTTLQLQVLGLSAIRFLVFTVQYLILLRWMDIPVSPVEGLCTAFLFFWAIAVIPSIALAELGIRGQVSLFLFHNFSTNTMGILAATIGLWCINLVIPAVVGSILLIRMRILR
jgi:hypothetical protein